MIVQSQQSGELALWPSLVYNEWKDTLDTLHLWMQIVGKVKLALCPFINQWWQVAFYVTTRGMTTGRIPYKKSTFQVNFDFMTHHLSISTSEGKEIVIPLQPRSVKDFYSQFMEALKSLGITVSIRPIPSEMSNAIPFHEDTKHASYDGEYVSRWWRIQLQVNEVFEVFRSPFRGKSSPIHFFWGSFDLNGTRFSGKKAKPPKLKGEMGKIMRFAENEENFAFGFWPGDERFPYPAFYTYLYPAPQSYETIKTGPSISYFNKKLSECILPYEEVRRKKSSEKEMLHFLETTYVESAKLAGWDIAYLQGPVPQRKMKK